MAFQTIFFQESTAHIVHTIFEYLAIAVAVWLYRRIRHQKGGESLMLGKTFYIILGCILGAAIGNKLVFWIEFADKISELWVGLTQLQPRSFVLLFSGQSIVGGLLGGLIGIELTKKIVGSTQSTGDDFVLPIIVGTIIGRIGCFLAGLNDGTYGIATSLPWGVDFGDGIARHPTQLYDIGFVIVTYFILWKNRAKWKDQAGLLFKFYLLGYLVWRLLIDALKPVPFRFPFGLSGIQVVCLYSIVVYAPIVWRHYCALRHKSSKTKGH